tara:strand:+ start:6301 stop:6543 length:243 start_codon:yes stop_codon:yes gene_type:complete
MTKQKRTDEHRNFVTVALTQITGDLERVKALVEKNEQWLAKLNGRVRDNEKDISRIKGIGGTIATLIIALLGWFKIGDFK